MNSELEKVADWCNASFLSLNVKKQTNQFYMVFSGVKEKLCLDELYLLLYQYFFNSSCILIPWGYNR